MRQGDMQDKQNRTEQLSVLVELGRIIADSSSTRQTLQEIAQLLADKFQVEVCSIYLLNRSRGLLVLEASVGLVPESIGQISMPPHEGLTGLTLEKKEPLFVVQLQEHPRFKYFQQSGEEVYQTFLGLPLIYHQHLQGVLVIQTRAEDAISASEIGLFSAIASQISSIAAYTGLMQDVQQEREQVRGLQQSMDGLQDQSNLQSRDRKSLLRGVPASSGFGQGRVHYLGQGIGFEQVEVEYAQDVEQEEQRLEQAFQEAQEEIRDLEQSAGSVSAEEQSLWQLYLSLLQDQGFKRRIRDRIQQGYSAAYSLKLAVLQYLEHFSELADPYLRERGQDVENAGRQVLHHLLGISQKQDQELKQETVLVASDLAATELMALRQENLKGIVLSKGGKTSHTVILARSLEIPAVIGVGDVLDRIQEGDQIIVDGDSGLIFPRPSQEIETEYARLARDKKDLDSRLHALRDLPAVTRDGAKADLGANIGLLSDMELVHRHGAEFIGLYRTEFPFLARSGFPSEQEQFELYKSIVHKAQGRQVSIRSLDVGGDKFLSYLDYPREDNPYLGWRSIRISLEKQEVFRTQLRAMLRASAFGQVRIMLPMIGTVAELRLARELIEQEKANLRQEGEAFDLEIPVGIMLEIPGTVKLLPSLAQDLDFISVGSNDLLQYTLAVDRNNPKVASMYQPLHPGFLLTMQEIAEKVSTLGKEVTVCGEAASNRLCAYLFLALGLNKLSMNPAAIPLIKGMVRGMELERARQDLETVLQMQEAEEVEEYLGQRMPEVGS
ncbi:MAG: phosphoenolpyruvate--protein phosphotransferase, partial [Desulfohalobiaceae bacterium]